MNEPRSAGSVRVQFVPVGRHRREWLWTARDEGSNTITVSGRFESLGEAMRDAREQIDGRDGAGGRPDHDPFAA